MCFIFLNFWLVVYTLRVNLERLQIRQEFSSNKVFFSSKGCPAVTGGEALPCTWQTEAFQFARYWSICKENTFTSRNQGGAEGQEEERCIAEIPPPLHDPNYNLSGHLAVSLSVWIKAFFPNVPSGAEVKKGAKKSRKSGGLSGSSSDESNSEDSDKEDSDDSFNSVSSGDDDEDDFNPFKDDSSEDEEDGKHPGVDSPLT